MIIKGTFSAHRLLYVIVGHKTTENRALKGDETNVQKTTVCWTADQTIAVRSLYGKAIPLRGYNLAPHGWSGPV
jgi:hypothetical protein